MTGSADSFDSVLTYVTALEESGRYKDVAVTTLGPGAAGGQSAAFSLTISRDKSVGK